MIFPGVYPSFASAATEALGRLWQNPRTTTPWPGRNGWTMLFDDGSVWALTSDLATRPSKFPGGTKLGSVLPLRWGGSSWRMWRFQPYGTRQTTGPLRSTLRLV